MFERIINKKLAFPPKIPISNKMKDLINGLLQKKPEERIGYKNIKEQELFNDIDWGKVSRLEYEPLFKPQITDPLKAENFDTDFTREEARMSIVDDKKLQKLNNYQE